MHCPELLAPEAIQQKSVFSMERQVGTRQLEQYRKMAGHKASECTTRKDEQQHITITCLIMSIK